MIQLNTNINEFESKYMRDFIDLVQGLWYHCPGSNIFKIVHKWI